MKQEKEYLEANKKQSVNLVDYPYKKGDKVGNFIVNSDNYVYHHKRYQVELTCECGKIVYRRLNNILKLKNIWCSKCKGYNLYPERRKSSAWFTKGIHILWYNEITSNLHRGNRIIDCKINIEDLKTLYDDQKGICPYTGIYLNVLDLLKKESNASIDRTDSSKGYTMDNIKWVYKPLNIMKNRYSLEEFLFVCKKVTNFTDNFEPS